MKGLSRQAMGWDLRFAEFLALAPLSCVAVFAAGIGLVTATRSDMGEGIGAAVVFFVGGLWVMAVHYLVATIPSLIAWGLTVRLARLAGLGPNAAMLVAAPVTALKASLLLLVWLRDEDCRAMVPAITLVSVPVSFLVAERIIRSHVVQAQS
jgi:hypothetical protein